MRRRCGDEDDAVARFEPAVAVDDQAGGERPARVGLGLDFGQHLLRHAGIVLKRHGGNGGGLPFAVDQFAHEAR